MIPYILLRLSFKTQLKYVSKSIQMVELIFYLNMDLKGIINSNGLIYCLEVFLSRTKHEG